MKWDNKKKAELGSTLNWKKPSTLLLLLPGRSRNHFLPLLQHIFYLKLCFCSYNKALTSSFFWLLLGNQSKSEIDLRWKISALFLSYCLLFWNDLEYIPTYIYISYIYFLSLNFFFIIFLDCLYKKRLIFLTSFFFEESQFDEFYDTMY